MVDAISRNNPLSHVRKMIKYVTMDRKKTVAGHVLD